MRIPPTSRSVQRFTVPIAAVLVFNAGCSGSDEPALATPAPAVTSSSAAPGGGLVSPIDAAALAVVADAALRQVELGGLRADVAFVAADWLLSASRSCAAIIIGVDGVAVSTAYMALIAGRPAAQFFPRADQMNPEYLGRWDAGTEGEDWGLIALAPPETDVNDVSTMCGQAFLDEALVRHFAIQIEPE